MFYLCSDALCANRGRAFRRSDMSVQLTNNDACLPENWLVHGPALETRRRRSGADAQRGFEYQRAFAVWKIAQLLDDANEIVGVRYEGAQDVDLLMADGRVVFVQLKDTPEETYPPSQIAPILTGFVLDLLDSGEDERANFEFIVPTTPGAPALRRLACRKTTPIDQEIYRHELLQEPSLAALAPDRVDSMLRNVLDRITVRLGMGRTGERYSASIFTMLAERALREGGVADDHVAGLLAQIETSLKGRPITSKAQMRDLAYAARRLPARACMAPSLPAHFQPRGALLDRMRARLLSDARLATVGLGGSGKTTLAQALAADPDVIARYPDGVLWIRLGQKPNIVAQLQSVLRVLNRRIDGANDEAALRGELDAALSGRSYLIVLDDLWDTAVGSIFTPPEGCGLVITCRQPRIAKSLDAAIVEVRGLLREEALGLIERIAGPIVDQDRASAEGLVARVGGLALAVRLGASLVANGRSFDRLIKDLDTEETLLSALDIDQGDANSPDDERRRDKSIEACLALSVDALGPELRASFFRIAVLPRNVEIDPELGAVIFAMEDVSAARERLFELSTRGLVTLSGPAYVVTFRIHDLVMDYARTAFGPGRRRIATAPAQLPKTLPALHAELLNRSLHATASGFWAEMLPDFYFDDHLGMHLIASGRTVALAGVLRETEDGHASWLARQRRHQNTAGFLEFVRVCLDESFRTVLDRAGDVSQAALTDMMTAAVAGASAVRRAANIPAGLLGALVRAGELSFDDALANAGLCNYAQRAFHLVDLLPHASASDRSAVIANLVAELVRTPLPLMADQELLDILLPQLSDFEIEIVWRSARCSPEVESELLWALARNTPVGRSDRMDKIVARCRQSEEPDLRDTIVLLAADGLGGIEVTAEMIHSSMSSKRQHVKSATFLTIPPDELARHITTMEIASYVVERWEQHPSRISTAATEAITRVIASYASDTAQGALLDARLMAMTGKTDSARIAKCENAFASVGDDDWRKADGYGWLMQAAPPDRRSDLAGRYVQAASARRFVDFGVRRFRQIAALLPIEWFVPIVCASRAAPPDKRAGVLAGLLEQAPYELWGMLATEIYRESAHSGRTGDIFLIAKRIPAELLTGLWHAVDQISPTPELVHAAAALSERLPTNLVNWFERDWLRLQSYERMRAASGHPDIASLYSSRQAMLADIAQAIGLLGEDGQRRPIDVNEADAKRLVSLCTAEDVRRFIDDNPKITIDVANYDIARLLDVFGKGISHEAIRDMWLRAGNKSAHQRMAVLGHVADLLRDGSGIEEAITALIEDGSRSGAAIWLARHSHLIRGEDLARLHPLRAPDMQDRDAIMLEVVLHPHLGEQAKLQIERSFVGHRGLLPGFVALLDRSSYPQTMKMAFDQCLDDFVQARLRSDAKGNLLFDAKQLLDLPEECLPALRLRFAADSETAAVFSAVTLLTATGMEIGKLCEAIRRVALLVDTSLGKDRGEVLAAEMTASAKAHSR